MTRTFFGFCTGSIVAGLAILVDATLGGGQATVATEPAPATQADIPVIRERIVDLPEDGGAWWFTVCLPDNPQADPRSRWLLAALSVDPRLRSLEAQCKTHRFTPTDPLYKARWSKQVSELPALFVQTPDGRTCYKASGENLPATPELLADEIDAAIATCRPRPRPRPRPNPEPAPTPAPAPAPAPAPTPRPTPPAPIPDLRPRTPSAGGGVALAALAGLIGAGVGAATEWRKSNRV